MQPGPGSPAYSADATARGFAKLGLLYVRGGAWDGEQIIPAAWVDATRTPSPANAEYGAFWWLDPARPGVLLGDGALRARSSPSIRTTTWSSSSWAPTSGGTGIARSST